MYYTYVLLCIDKYRSRFYIGLTENLENRLREHQNKEVNTTKSFNSVDLIYFEACLNKTDARQRELQLKTGFGRGYIKRRLEKYLKSRE